MLYLSCLSQGNILYSIERQRQKVLTFEKNTEVADSIRSQVGMEFCMKRCALFIQMGIVSRAYKEPSDGKILCIVNGEHIFRRDEDEF